MADTYRNSVAAGNHSTELAKHILSRLFRNFDGCFRIRLWDGSDSRRRARQARVLADVPSPRAFQSMVFSHHPLRVVDSYFRGLIDIDGDLYSALKLRHFLSALRLPPLEKAALAAKALMIKPDKTESNGSRRWARNCQSKTGAGA